MPIRKNASLFYVSANGDITAVTAVSDELAGIVSIKAAGTTAEDTMNVSTFSLFATQTGASIASNARIHESKQRMRGISNPAPTIIRN